MDKDVKTIIHGIVKRGKTELDAAIISIENGDDHGMVHHLKRHFEMLRVVSKQIKDWEHANAGL